MQKVSGTVLSVFAPARPRRKVVAGNEFHRIKNLPRRTQDDTTNTTTMSEALRAPGGKMKLWPIQVAALRDIYNQKGAFLPIGVGRGKTLVSLLAPVILGAKRPLLVVPASLRDQTRNEVLPQMKDHWTLHPNLAIVSYTSISLAQNARFLDQYDPDLIIFDECHSLKNLKAGRTRRVRRYLNSHPDTIVIAMSGTVSNRSLMDYGHIVEWCLGTHHTPLPTRYHELYDWSCAIDEGVPPDQEIDPGALRQFCEGDENIRQGFRRRLTETPGVVASLGEDGVNASLVIERCDHTLPKTCAKLIETMQNIWETPNEDIIQSPTELIRHSKELALGFYYRWEPAPPKPWSKARRNWRKYVQHVLAHNRRGLDTPLQVWNETELAAKFEDMRELPPPGVDEFIEWRAAKDCYQYEQIAEWVDNSALKWMAEWLRETGICWVWHKAIGEKLAKMTKLPYFGGGSKASHDILTVNGPIIVSIQAHGQGKNLQRYSRNFVTMPPSAGKTWEQLLGRTHRAGQEDDEVSFEVMLHTAELQSAFEKAQSDAIYLEDSLGGRQKLNYARIVT